MNNKALFRELGVLGPIAIATAWLGHEAVSAITTRLGHPGATLDDAYIHFQYAKAIAQGHPFRFQAGQPFTMGATSLLWPVVLAPFYALGLRGESILWPAWLISFACLALLARETYLVARRLVGETCAIGAAALVLSCTGLLWFAASGMEGVPFAFVLMRVVRRASEWVEGPPSAVDAEAGARLGGAEHVADSGQARDAGAAPRHVGPEADPTRSRARMFELVGLSWLASLLRPEGAIASMILAGTLLAVRARGPRWRAAAVALAAPVFPFVLSLALTGSWRSSTAEVKLLPGNPYYAGHALVEEVAKNLKVFYATLLQGEIWSAEFLPQGGAVIALLGLGAIAARGVQTGARVRALYVLFLALAACAPCAYVTFLWNRLRYLWPFAPAWMIGLACGARVVGDLLGRLGRSWRAGGALVCGVLAGLLLSRKEFVLQDLADSASGIDRQQATLGRWAKENLPEDARIGVNDTGAIAYFSDRTTFDIVGLTSKGEGRYWVAGAGSRFEHYERLYAKSPELMPTHFIVYPAWMACDALLGRTLYEATVLDSSILGGTTMRVHEADYTLLGSGEAPWTAGLDVYDALDVADLESEAAHGYELLGAKDGEQIVYAAAVPGIDETKFIADGGRTGRTDERFRVDVSGADSVGIVRLAPIAAAKLHVLVGGQETKTFDLEKVTWVELAFPVPLSGKQTVELRTDGGGMSVFHYWFARRWAGR